MFRFFKKSLCLEVLRHYSFTFDVALLIANLENVKNQWRRLRFNVDYEVLAGRVSVTYLGSEYVDQIDGLSRYSC